MREKTRNAANRTNLVTVICMPNCFFSFFFSLFKFFFS